VFDQKLGKSLSARVFFYWPTANVPVGMPHALGKKPSGWREVTKSRGTFELSTTTNSTTTLTSVALFGKVRIGDIISGTGIPDGTYVAAKASDSSLTMSAAATDATTTTREFTGPPGAIYAPVGYSANGAKETQTDASYNYTRNYIVLACETAGAWAEVEVFA
jgi:hypothetical protein